MSQELKRCFAAAIHNSFMTAGLLLHFEFNITPPPPLLSMLTVRDRVKPYNFHTAFVIAILEKGTKNRTTGLSGRICISPTKIKSM